MNIEQTAKIRSIFQDLQKINQLIATVPCIEGFDIKLWNQTHPGNYCIPGKIAHVSFEECDDKLPMLLVRVPPNRDSDDANFLRTILEKEDLIEWGASTLADIYDDDEVK